jgi:hypothetical protein
MRALADRLHVEVRERKLRTVLGTREEWNAIKCLEDAGRALWSASVWLSKAQDAAQPRGVDEGGSK